ncbi:hypothetical protein CENSYa_1394 [Cenarchaeum symbiosum A]|uniref:EF-hand domain-containing protein n=1 Tax=Cenarchaeum symbiosum (strain A) TaxID=414004 RepID=A0RXF0_CENSY|nr:hypothetical protein CENSYa_1394 [Cenarchaeum symbiosum A]
MNTHAGRLEIVINLNICAGSMSTYRMATCGIGTALAAVLTLMMVPSGASITDDGPTMYGMAEVTFRDANGDVLSYNTLHNAITNDGERAILNAIFLNQIMDPPVVICMSDVDSGDDAARELANKTFSHSPAFASLANVTGMEIPDPLFRPIFEVEVINISTPREMTVVDSLVVNNTEFVTTEETIVPAGTVVIINDREVTLDVRTTLNAGRTVLSVPTSGLPGVQNVTFNGPVDQPGFSLEADDVFFYVIELPDFPPLPVGTNMPPNSFNISNVTDIFDRYELAPNTENRTADFDGNGMIDEGEWEVIFIPPVSSTAPCMVSPSPNSTVLVTENFLIDGALVSRGDIPNLDNIVEVIPGPINNTFFNGSHFLINQSIPVNTTISVIPSSVVNITLNEENSTAVISANFTTTRSIEYSIDAGGFVTTPANFAPDQPLNSMLICSLDPIYDNRAIFPTPITTFPDCDLAAGEDGFLFSIIDLDGQMAGPDDRVEVTYTLDISSDNS